MTTEVVFFALLALAAVASAAFMVLHRNPVMCAIALIANFFCLAGLYLLLRAQLLAVVQVVVYAGAIMVLVVFVIMLLNLGDEQRLVERIDVRRIIGVVVAIGFLAEMLFLFVVPGSELLAAPVAGAPEVGSVESMGKALFGPYLLAFEMTSFLLLAAVVGAVILAKKQL